MKHLFLALLLGALAAFSPLTKAQAEAPVTPPQQPEKTVCLTFDDGPTDSTTPKILDVLKKEGVKATFFVIGRQIQNREDILRRESEEGHVLGIHTYSHEYGAIYASKQALLDDIGACKKAIRKVLPEFNTDLYRFPGGSYTVRQELIEAVENAGYRWYDWNASAEDAVNQNASPEDLFENAVSSANGKKHVVLLMHDGVKYKSTIRCLPRLIRYFRKEGYIFKTL